MMSSLFTRREVAVRLLYAVPALALAAEGQTTKSEASGSDSNGLSRNCECIHQEVVIKASRDRVYRALTDAKQFSKLTELSYHAVATEISSEVGGTFSLFGGVIVGRHIEMLPGERLVQAWRENSWEPGAYSIASFQFKDAGSETKVIFDHRGFPQGSGEHLAIGWQSHYWQPLQKYLA